MADVSLAMLYWMDGIMIVMADASLTELRWKIVTILIVNFL
jgi:hypothetical protein